MTNWTRAKVSELSNTAMALGMTPEDVERAFIIGARFIALGYSDAQIEDMDLDYRRLRRVSWERWGR